MAVVHVWNDEKVSRLGSRYSQDHTPERQEVKRGGVEIQRAQFDGIIRWLSGFRVGFACMLEMPSTQQCFIPLPSRVREGRHDIGHLTMT